jgi:XTP/dITP diphosphohydrolase
VKEMKIVVATKNPGKAREFKKILSGYDIEILLQDEVCPEVEIDENGSTFSENAKIKAMAIYNATGLTTIADDSGLTVDALNGAPGIYSARYCGVHGNDKANNQKLLQEMQGVENRKAHFVCSICCVMAPNGEVILTDGVLDGEIGFEEKGENGFGYDSLFLVGNRTTAQMSEEEKNAISHRAKALEKFVAEFKKYL